MSRNYKFHNPVGVYFVSFAVVEWIDVFTRNEYKDILLDSLRYYQQEKGMEILLGSFKRFTSKAIVAAIKENPQESRKEWLLKQFEEAGRKSSNVKQYQLWRHDNKPIELWSNKVIDEKLNYIHNNPVEEGIVFRAEQYVYSSAIDYAGEKGLLDIVLI